LHGDVRRDRRRRIRGRVAKALERIVIAVLNRGAEIQYRRPGTVEQEEIVVVSRRPERIGPLQDDAEISPPAIVTDIRKSSPVPAAAPKL
jgi:hypothetical protein